MEQNTIFLEPNMLNDEQSTLTILDQTLLPGEIRFIQLKTGEDIWEAIHSLRVRGAPAIGIAAAFGAYLGAKAVEAQDFDSFYNIFKEKCEYIASSRPTAVNLFWAINRMDACAIKNKAKSIPEIKAALLCESLAIRDEDIEQNRRIAMHTLSLLNDGDTILTHCNAGPIATSHYGTALGAPLLAKERGMDIKVFADETRPLLQGARLTSFELHRAGVDVTLICDNMASIVMSQGKIQACLVGCDRVAANGDTANKIGTSGVAILAKHYGIPFYVCGPTSTIDMATLTGSDICIEQRSSLEITHLWYEKPMAPEGVKTYNPAFDVTDHSLITAIITEHGIAYPPFDKSLQELF